MEGLYRKVLRGAFPRIPPCFSSDLSQVIPASTFLPQVNDDVGDKHATSGEPQTPTDHIPTLATTSHATPHTGDPR